MSPQIHPDAPTDSGGNPVHPETGKPICGRGKSDRTSETEHGRERDDVPYCTLVAGWGTDYDEPGVACSHHGGAADNRGENNGNFKHGAFSEHFASDLSEREQEAYTDLVGALEDQGDATKVLREAAAELFLKYKRSADPRFLTEARQLLSEFGIVEAAPSKHEVDVDGDVSGSFDVNISHHRVTEEDTDDSDE